MVLLPAPAGPSIAMMSLRSEGSVIFLFGERSRRSKNCTWSTYELIAYGAEVKKYQGNSIEFVRCNLGSDRNRIRSLPPKGREPLGWTQSSLAGRSLQVDERTTQWY